MGSLTDDPNDERLKPYREKGGPDKEPVPQQEVYLVLPEAERAKGFLRPVRRAYRHVGKPKPKNDLRDLTPEEQQTIAGNYVKYEEYPDSERPALGRYWTQEELDRCEAGCKSTTSMSVPLAKTYARDPWFYSGTYCCGCRMHLPLDEFVWTGGGESMDPLLWPNELLEQVIQLKKEKR